MSYDLPSYQEASNATALQGSHLNEPSLLGMPDTLLLSILSHCDFVILQLALRPTCRRLNLFCLSLLRQAALQHYEQHLVPAYASASNPLRPTSRHEAQVLDLLIAALANLSRLRAETNLHILAADDLGEAYPELFERLQPQACLQDHLEELLSPQQYRELVPEDISLLFSKRRVTLQLPVQAASSSQGRTATIRKKVFDLPRPFDEALEVTAQRLAAQLAHWRITRQQAGSLRWYRWL